MESHSELLKPRNALSSSPAPGSVLISGVWIYSNQKIMRLALSMSNLRLLQMSRELQKHRTKIGAGRGPENSGPEALKICEATVKVFIEDMGVLRAEG